MECARAVPEHAYASSKLGVHRWMRRTAVSSEWAGRGIALNAVAPGTIRTPMTAPYLQTEEGRALLRHSTPTAGAEYGEPADVAEVIGFLATMETHYLLGQTIFVDGGTEVLLRSSVDKDGGPGQRG
jgi:NAD(P)-dependent dehydrogenase (short-subunit alcohol dehydrogenase family)